MYRKILVAADGSATAALAVERAAEVAQASGDALTVLTVGSGDEARATAQAEVERVRQLTAGAVTAEAKMDTGDPSTQILAEATSGGYDLLVAGNKGMTGASRFLHTSSVPNKVSHHAPIALLIDRTT